jgi:hypothetical protein
MRWICLVFLCVSFALSAQQEGRIETDRPDQTECPFIVRKGYFQAEMGFNRNVSKDELDYLMPTSLWKFGLVTWAELRLNSVLQKQGDISRFKMESVGAKFHLVEGKKWVPRTAVIVQYDINSQNRDASERNEVSHSLGNVVFTMQNSLGGPFGVGYNIGSEFHSNGGMEGIIRVAPNVNLGQNGYAYIEFFGRLPKSNLTDTWVDGGLAYYVTDELKLDVSLGKSLNVGQLWYAAVGISFRVKLF